MKNKEKIIEFICENKKSKTSEIAEMLGLSEARTRAILKELVAEGQLAASGGTKNKIYHLSGDLYSKQV